VPKTALTKSLVSHATCSPPKRKVDYFDDELPGFLLEVRQSGGKTYYQRYRDRHGRERQYKIGSAAVLTVQQARTKAREIAAQAALGSDPQAIRQELRKTPTLQDFVRDEYLPFAKGAKRSWKTDETLLRLHILPMLGRVTLDEIDDRKVGELLQGLQSAGYSSGTLNRTTILIRYLFNQARRWGIPGVTDNPATDFKIIPDVCRERFLSIEELQRLIQSLDVDQNKVAAAAIKLLLLTGARRNEVTQARWEYVDWDKRRLLVPLSKNGKPRHIKLNDKAIDILKSHSRIAGNPFIFPSATTGKPCPSLFFPWSRIRERAGLADVRLHDLRHSFASFLVNDDVEIYRVQRLLGHANIRSTQRYAHLTESTLDDAAEVAARIFEKAATRS
jgi:integrase